MIFETAFWKKILAPVVYGAIAVLGVEVEMVSALVWLVCIDMIMGIGAVYGVKETFVLRRLFGGFISKFLMLMIPFTVVFVGKGVGLDLGIVVQASIGILCVSEGISILENFLSMKQQKRVESHDVITPFIGMLKNIFEGILDGVMKKMSGKGE